MKHKAVFTFLLAAATLMLPAAAHAGPRVEYEQTFSTPVPGAPTGVDTRIVYSHPDDPNAKPIPVRREVFVYPKGTEFDSSAVPDCTATDLELQVFGTAACPPESRIGGGDEGTFMTGFGPDETPMEIDIFDDGSAFVVLGSPKDLPPLRQAARATRQGRVITVDAPHMPGGPPDGESAIRRVHNVIDARSLGDRAYIRTPAECPPRGVWKFKAIFTFADGVVEKAKHKTPCVAPSA